MLVVLVTALCAVAASHNARAATVIHANDTVTQADIVSETVEYYANALDVDTLVRKRAAVSSASVIRLRACLNEKFSLARRAVSARTGDTAVKFSKSRGKRQARGVSHRRRADIFFPLPLSHAMYYR